MYIGVLVSHPIRYDPYISTFESWATLALSHKHLSSRVLICCSGTKCLTFDLSGTLVP